MSPGVSKELYLFLGLAFLSFPCHGQEKSLGCSHGYLEVGRQSAAEETIVYCSAVPCDQIPKEVRRSFEILGKIEGVEAAGDPDLRAWHEQSERAQVAAVQAAAAGIERAISALRGMQLEYHAKMVENEQGRLAFAGVRDGGDARKLQAFRKAVAAWDAAASETARPTFGGTGMQSWLELGDWANGLAAKLATMTSAWQGIANDAATKTVMGKMNVTGTLAAAGNSLEPAVKYRYDRAGFLAAYGYNWADWQGRRRAIMAEKGLPDQTVTAVCKAEKYIAIDLRNQQVCMAHLPKPEDAEPEQRQCGASSQ